MFWNYFSLIYFLVGKLSDFLDFWLVGKVSNCCSVFLFCPFLISLFLFSLPWDTWGRIYGFLLFSSRKWKGEGKISINGGKLGLTLTLWKRIHVYSVSFISTMELFLSSLYWLFFEVGKDLETVFLERSEWDFLFLLVVMSLFGNRKELFLLVVMSLHGSRREPFLQGCVVLGDTVHTLSQCGAHKHREWSQ